MGTPVDQTPEIAREAIARAANSPGYPMAHGTPELRAAVCDYLRRRWHAVDLDPAAVLPTMGAKEFVAWLPTFLGLGPGDLVLIPATAYPTYEVGARLVGAEVLATDDLTALDAEQIGRTRLIWVNSPANPSGRIWPAERLRQVVRWAREHDVLVASDECYLEYAWEATAVSILHPDVCDGTTDRLLSVHSLSKRSNLAGYRAGFVAGDSLHVERILDVRRHSGMMVSKPVQQAMMAVLGDDSHVEVQRERYHARRELLRDALGQAGFSIDHSEGSLYLWATRDESCWETVRWCADRGILVTPGDFYGAAGVRHVRVALTATDERVKAAAQRLAFR